MKRIPYLALAASIAFTAAANAQPVNPGEFSKPEISKPQVTAVPTPAATPVATVKGKPSQGKPAAVPAAKGKVVKPKEVAGATSVKDSVVIGEDNEGIVINGGINIISYNPTVVAQGVQTIGQFTTGLQAWCNQTTNFLRQAINFSYAAQNAGRYDAAYRRLMNAFLYIKNSMSSHPQYTSIPTHEFISNIVSSLEFLEASQQANYKKLTFAARTFAQQALNVYLQFDNKVFIPSLHNRFCHGCGPMNDTMLELEQIKFAGAQIQWVVENFAEDMGSIVYPKGGADGYIFLTMAEGVTYLATSIIEDSWIQTRFACPQYELLSIREGLKAYRLNGPQNEGRYGFQDITGVVYNSYHDLKYTGGVLANASMCQ